jgi:hypothetical protein
VLPFAKVERDVKPERASKDGSKYPKMVELWWRYWNERTELYRRIAGLERVIVITLVSSVVQPARVANPQVFAHKLGVFASDSSHLLGLLACAVHGEWVRKHSSSLETRINYSPSDVFETFPFPPSLASLEAPGQVMESARNAVMRGRTIGLTPTYNLVNNPAVTDADVIALREAHLALDEATLRAYGWDDLTLDHGFYDTAQGRRFTISPAARVELLDRLLELNHRRYAEEVVAGLHERSAKRGRSAKPSSSTGHDGPGDQMAML